MILLSNFDFKIFITPFVLAMIFQDKTWRLYNASFENEYAGIAGTVEAIFATYSMNWQSSCWCFWEKSALIFQVKIH